MKGPIEERRKEDTWKRRREDSVEKVDESQKRKSVGSGKLRLRFKLLTSYFAEPPSRPDFARFIPEAHCF